MADVHSKEVRSYNMSQIKGRNTKPELQVRKFLFREGFRYRLNEKRLPGSPDIVLPRYRTLVFVHGCFWHGHQGCQYFKIPKTKTSWWTNKIDRNRINDKQNKRKLLSEGWKVIIIWECQLRKNGEKTLIGLAEIIKKNA